jgi:hypothetical protein
MRVIEKLRQFIKDKLEQRDYVEVDANGDELKSEADRHDDDAQSLYPVLQAVREDRD